MTEVYLMIIGMMIVTVIPRILPAALFSEIKPPPFWRRFLYFVPFAALGALIFPAVLYSTETMESAIFGGLVAVILALIKPSLLPVVIGATLAVLLWETGISVNFV